MTNPRRRGRRPLPWFPVVLLFALGGPVGRVASVALIGVSLLLQAVRGDGGCEVMSIPAIIFRKRTYLAYVAFFTGGLGGGATRS